MLDSVLQRIKNKPPEPIVSSEEVGEPVEQSEKDEFVQKKATSEYKEMQPSPPYCDNGEEIEENVELVMLSVVEVVSLSIKTRNGGVLEIDVRLSNVTVSNVIVVSSS